MNYNISGTAKGTLIFDAIIEADTKEEAKNKLLSNLESYGDWICEECDDCDMKITVLK